MTIVVTAGALVVTLSVRVVRVLVLAMVVNSVLVGVGMHDIAESATRSVQRSLGMEVVRRERTGSRRVESVVAALVR